MAAIGQGASGNDGVYNYLKKTYTNGRIEALIHNRREFLKKLTKTKIDEGPDATRDKRKERRQETPANSTACIHTYIN